MDLEALAERYGGIDKDGEEKLLRAIFAAGWEAGCWLRVPDERLLLNTRDQVDQLLDLVKKRAGFPLDFGDDPNPGGLPFSPVEGEEPCFVVVGQRCDLIAQFRTEPLIELVPARHTRDKGDIKSRWDTSPREFPLDPEAVETFLVDIRPRYWLPKIDLVAFEAKQALRPDASPNHVRFRFGLRLAQRYTRTALPDRLAGEVFNPLKKIIKGDSDADRLFSEWMIYHGGRWPEDRPYLVGIYAVPDLDDLPEDVRPLARSAIQSCAEDKFNAVIKELVLLSPDAEALLNLDDDPTGTIDDAELPHALWRAAWKLDLDAATFGGEASGALPAR